MEVKRTADYYYKTAKKLMRDGKFSRALKISREGLSFYPSYANLKLIAALVQIKLGNFPVAKNALNKLHDKIPDDADLLAGLCEVHLSLGKKAKADFYAKKAAFLYKNSASLMENIALSYAGHNFYEDALVYFNKALKLDTSNPYIYLGLGISSDQLGKTEKSIYYLKYAVRLKKNFYEALNYLANIYYDCKNIKQAVKLFEKIPCPQFSDPVSIKRLLSYYKDRKHLRSKVQKLKKRLQILLSGRDIQRFMTALEKKARTSTIKSAGKIIFLKPSPANILTLMQKTYLYDIDRYLSELFKTPCRAGFDLLPVLKRVNKNYIEKLMNVFKLYLESFSTSEKPGKLWDFELMNFYLMAVFKLMYDEKPEFKINQQIIDGIFNGIIKIVKSISISNRHREAFIELAAFIIAFWTYEDMLSRIILVREVLTTKEKKLVEPIILRGRAWRKWLGFKADMGWSYPWAQIFGRMPKTYGENKTVKCSSCRSVIKDFWNITGSYNNQPVRCGDCVSITRCRKCKGPMRHIYSEKQENNIEKQIYKCMQCAKTQKITVKMVR